MFVITQDNQVVLGPMRWNRFRFENFLAEELEINHTLPQDNNGIITVTDSVKIYPVQGSPDPVFNAKIEMLHGPFWQFTDTAAVSSYQVVAMPIDAVKNQLKAQVAAQRWQRENTPVEVTINGTAYRFRTDRETRNVLSHALTQGGPINWKVDGDTWITLATADLETVLAAVMSQVQASFDWEFAKAAEISVCTTLAELDAVNIQE